jgi:hypothetical protein
MAEWSNAAVSKTVVRRKMDRGFESPSLRQSNPIPYFSSPFAVHFFVDAVNLKKNAVYFLMVENRLI